MEIADLVAALRTEGGLLVATAARQPLDTPVPTCPGWTLGQLLHHVGMVHRWAAATLRAPDGRPGRPAEPGREPGDADLVRWVADGHADLVATLEAADPELSCWHFLPAPSGSAFWARRQLHETAIHRADVEAAAHLPLSPVAGEVAEDGLDELLRLMLTRPRGTLRADPARTLHLHAADTDGEWLVRITPGPLEVTRERARADLALRGTASDLYLWAWNRRSTERLEVAGDSAVLDLWRQHARITWD